MARSSKTSAAGDRRQAVTAMRLWTLHPKYLDARGLVALWREALLAQAVLSGRTRGCRRHPQLKRFRDSPAPMRAIAAYLRVLHEEAARRGDRFEPRRIGRRGRVGSIVTTRGQLDYEWHHLQAKLCRRAPAWHAQIRKVARPRAHPLFRIVPGGMADWEVRSGRRARSHPDSNSRAPRE
jgi:hypothetical protein